MQKEEQPSLLNLETTDEAKCPRCQVINRAMFPMEEYTCGHCGHQWQPATQATRQPLFPTKDECSHCQKIAAHLAANKRTAEVRCRRGHMVKITQEVT